MLILTLARTFGEPNPDRFAEQISERHLRMWQLLEGRDPSSEARADLRAAIVAQVAYSGVPGREPRSVQSFLAVPPGTREERMSQFRADMRRRDG